MEQRLLVRLAGTRKNSVNQKKCVNVISVNSPLHPLEKLKFSICKYIRCGNKTTSNIAVYGELGRFPVYR